MAAATTLKLPEELKARIASAAGADAGGPLYAMEEVLACSLARTAGKAAKRPKPTVRTDSKSSARSDTKNKSNRIDEVLDNSSNRNRHAK
ncbi:MAG: hypothetical protein ACLQHK_08685 [Gallionellaceae bacterium]